jgi:hypothetical protein
MSGVVACGLGIVEEKEDEDEGEDKGSEELEAMQSERATHSDMFSHYERSVNLQSRARRDKTR